MPFYKWFVFFLLDIQHNMELMLNIDIKRASKISNAWVINLAMALKTTNDPRILKKDIDNLTFPLENTAIYEVNFLYIYIL